MRMFLSALAALTLSCDPALAQQAPSAEQIYKAAGAKASKPIATISYGSDANQVADLRLPPGPGPFPVAVVIHGGCWRADVDTRAGIAGFADALTERGFATWNIEYRRTGNPGGGWPGTFEDVSAAVDKLAQIAPEHRLDMSRIAIVGHSSGAHLALWAASRHRLPVPWSAAAVRPASVVAIDGPSALAPFVGIDAKVCGIPVIVPFMGGSPEQKPEAYALASPANHLPLGVRQLSVGGQLAQLMRPYTAAVKDSGDILETLEPQGATHFDIVTPGTPNGEAVADFIAKNAFPEPVPRP